MSKTTDRLDELEAQTAPLPWPVEVFHDMPGDAFQLLFALSQAWPMLRRDTLYLEEEGRKLRVENTQLKAEHERIRTGANDAAHNLAVNVEHNQLRFAQMAEQMRALREEAEALRERVANLPPRFAAAEKLAASIDTTKSGSGGAFGAFDGAAYDAWKKAAEVQT